LPFLGSLLLFLLFFFEEFSSFLVEFLRFFVEGSLIVGCFGNDGTYFFPRALV
jgi:hypothetical protein